MRPNADPTVVPADAIAPLLPGSDLSEAQATLSDLADRITAAMDRAGSCIGTPLGAPIPHTAGKDSWKSSKNVRDLAPGELKRLCADLAVAEDDAAALKAALHDRHAQVAASLAFNDPSTGAERGVVLSWSSAFAQRERDKDYHQRAHAGLRADHERLHRDLGLALAPAGFDWAGHVHHEDGTIAWVPAPPPLPTHAQIAGDWSSVLARLAALEGKSHVEG